MNDARARDTGRSHGDARRPHGDAWQQVGACRDMPQQRSCVSSRLARRPHRSAMPDWSGESCSVALLAILLSAVTRPSVVYAWHPAASVAAQGGSWCLRRCRCHAAPESAVCARMRQSGGCGVQDQIAAGWRSRHGNTVKKTEEIRREAHTELGIVQPQFPDFLPTLNLGSAVPKPDTRVCPCLVSAGTLPPLSTRPARPARTADTCVLPRVPCWSPTCRSTPQTRLIHDAPLSSVPGRSVSGRCLSASPAEMAMRHPAQLPIFALRRVGRRSAAG